VATTTTPWYRDRNRQLAAAAVAVAVVALIAWFVVSSGRRKEEFAARSLNQARAAAEAGNLPLASSELQKVIQTYKGTDAANEAVITLNQVRMVNGQSELAAVGLKDFLAAKPDPKYAAPASGLLGAALENSQKWSDAGQAFSSASKAADLPYLKARYLVDAGRAYREGGKTQEAIAVYREIIEKYPKTTSMTEAQVRLAELTDGKM
jgi:TolA-binding protein